MMNFNGSYNFLLEEKMMNLVIPEGKMAGAQAVPPEEMKRIMEEAKKKREETAKALREGKPVTAGNNIVTPPGKLAGAQQLTQEQMQAKLEAERKRRELAEALKKGQPVTAGNNIVTPPGKLAVALQWYEKDPSLLVAEKAAMAKAFPNFQLEQIGDGRLAWTGTLTPGIWKGFWAAEDDLSARQTWEVMAIYENNHPHQQMGSSVKVFLLYPTIETVIEQIGWTPHHLLSDPISGQKYLCTARAEDVKVGETSTSAASVLAWAMRWLMSFELVMTGDLSKELFNTPNGI